MFDVANSAAGSTTLEEIDRRIAQQQDGDPTAAVQVIVAKGRTTLDPLNHFVAMFYENMDAILAAHANALSPRTLRILLHLLKRAQFGNLVLFAPAAISKNLGIDKGGVSRSIASLRKCGILLDLADGGTYLNPQVFTKGSLALVAQNNELMAEAIAEMQRRGMNVALGTPKQLSAAGILSKPTRTTPASTKPTIRIQQTEQVRQANIAQILGI